MSNGGVSSRTRSKVARATAAPSAPRRTSGGRARAAAAPAAPRASATPPSMSEPPATPLTPAGAGAAASSLPAAAPPRRRELSFSQPQTPSASHDREENIESEGLKTPTTTTSGDCAICISPLKKGNQPHQQHEAYTIQGCGHTFHRACLVESRRAGNRGCPYCRGELQQGLTPEPTAAERRAAAEQRAVSEARGAALDSATEAMEEVRSLLDALSAASEGARAVMAGSVTSSSSSTQAAVVRVLAVVRRSPAPSLAMYETASAALEAARVQLRMQRSTLAVVEIAKTREARKAAEEAVAATESKVRGARIAARAASRAALAETEGQGNAGSGDPAHALALGVEPAYEALAAALLAADFARASLARVASREEAELQEAATSHGLSVAEATARLDGLGGGSNENP